jgi:hypothetical protein
MPDMRFDENVQCLLTTNLALTDKKHANSHVFTSDWAMT